MIVIAFVCALVNARHTKSDFKHCPDDYLKEQRGSGNPNKAAIAPGNGERLIIAQIGVRAPQAGEVLVEMEASDLCHIDLSAVEGKFPVKLPSVLGHEGSDVVVQCGDGVTQVAPRDHVILNNTTHCGECRPCQRARRHACCRCL